MNDFTLLKLQKKEIYEMINQIGLDDNNFDLRREGSDYSEVLVSLLSYKNTKYYFKFDVSEQTKFQLCRYSPGNDKRMETTDFLYSWGEVKSIFLMWLKLLKSEIETLDPWEEIGKYIPGVKLDLEDEGVNDKFNKEELNSIKASIDKLKLEIKSNFNVNQIKWEIVNKKLDYVVDRAQKIGRIDWKNIFIAKIIDIGIILLLNSEQFKQLFAIFANCFKPSPPNLGIIV